MAFTPNAARKASKRSSACSRDTTAITSSRSKESSRAPAGDAAAMRVAIDTGGTFTDCAFVRDGQVEILKVPSTPGNPARAIAEALNRILQRTENARPAPWELFC